MEVAELRGKTADELRAELLRLRREQFSLRMQRASEQLPQTHLVTATRRDIARVKTLMREQELAGGAAAVGGGREKRLGQTEASAGTDVDLDASTDANTDANTDESGEQRDDG